MKTKIIILKTIHSIEDAEKYIRNSVTIHDGYANARELIRDHMLMNENNHRLIMFKVMDRHAIDEHYYKVAINKRTNYFFSLNVCAIALLDYANHNRVYGHGINDSTTNVKVNGKLITSYRKWVAMLERCYCPVSNVKRPTYIDCNVCDEWLIYSNYKKWHDEHYVEGYYLDKDLINPGAKEYSPINCCFLPSKINEILIKSNSKRGDYPIGVNYRKDYNKYVARGGMGSRSNGRKFIGHYDTKEDAFIAYKLYKEAFIKKIATDYFENRLITLEAYWGLMDYKVFYTD